MAKRITAMAGIRNSAAHGQPDKFTEGDVRLSGQWLQWLMMSGGSYLNTLTSLGKESS
jgi:hypothetical protein